MKYLKSIAVQNLGGLAAFKAEFSDVSVVCGANESGKSSLLQSIATIFEGGSDADLLHNGAKKGVSSIAFENGYTATKTIEPQKYGLVVVDPNGGKITSGAATLVRQWIPKDGFDIREILSKLINKPKDLEKFLLNNLPLTFDAKEINEAQGDSSTPIKGTLTLAEFNALRTARYDARTDAGRDKKNLEGTIATLENQLVAGDEKDWGAERDSLTRKLADIQTKKKQAESASSTILADALREKRAEIDAQIRKLEEQYATYEKGARAKAQELLAQETETLSEEFASVSVELTKARAQAERQTESAGVKKAIDTERQRLKGYITLESKLTTAITNLDALKARKLKQLPVEGLDIREDEKKNVTITVNEVPLQRLNTQQQIYLCVRFLLAAQKASGCEMKLMICEGAELDESHLVELGNACKEAGVQLIVSMRIDGAELQVLSLEEFAERYLVNGSPA